MPPHSLQVKLLTPARWKDLEALFQRHGFARADRKPTGGRRVRRAP